MANKERKRQQDRCLDKITLLWADNPEWTFGELLINIGCLEMVDTDTCRSPRELTDDQLEQKIMFGIRQYKKVEKKA